MLKALSAKTKFWLFLCIAAIAIAVTAVVLFQGRGPLFKGEVAPKEGKINIVSGSVTQGWLEATTILQKEILEFRAINKTDAAVEFGSIKFHQANPAERDKIQLNDEIFKNIKICKDAACWDAQITTQEFALTEAPLLLAQNQETVITVKADIILTEEQRAKILSIQATQCDDAMIDFQPRQPIQFAENACPIGNYFRVREFPRMRVTNNLSGEPGQIALAEVQEVMNFSLQNLAESQMVKIREINIKRLAAANSILLSDIERAELIMKNENFNAVGAWGDDIPIDTIRFTLSTGAAPGIEILVDDILQLSFKVTLKDDEALVGKSIAFRLENAESFVYLDTPPVVQADDSTIPLIGKIFNVVTQPKIIVSNSVPGLPEIMRVPPDDEEITKDLLNFTIQNTLSNDFTIRDINLLKNETDNEMAVEVDKLELHINGEKSDWQFSERPDDIYNLHSNIDFPVPPNETLNFSVKIKTTGDAVQGRTLQFQLPTQESIEHIGTPPIRGEFPIVGTLLAGIEEGEDGADGEEGEDEDEAVETINIRAETTESESNPLLDVPANAENVTLFQFELRNDGLGSAVIQSLTFTEETSVLSLGKIRNISLHHEREVWNEVTQEENNIRVRLADSSKEIAQGETLMFTLKGDLAAEETDEGKTFSLLLAAVEMIGGHGETVNVGPKLPLRGRALTIREAQPSDAEHATVIRISSPDPIVTQPIREGQNVTLLNFEIRNDGFGNASLRSMKISAVRQAVLGDLSNMKLTCDSIEIPVGIDGSVEFQQPFALVADSVVRCTLSGDIPALDEEAAENRPFFAYVLESKKDILLEPTEGFVIQKRGTFPLVGKIFYTARDPEGEMTFLPSEDIQRRYQFENDKVVLVAGETAENLGTIGLNITRRGCCFNPPLVFRVIGQNPTKISLTLKDTEDLQLGPVRATADGKVSFGIQDLKLRSQPLNIAQVIESILIPELGRDLDPFTLNLNIDPAADTPNGSEFSVEFRKGDNQFPGDHIEGFSESGILAFPRQFIVREAVHAGEPTRIDASAPNLPASRDLAPAASNEEVFKFRLSATRAGVQIDRLMFTLSGNLPREKVAMVELFEGTQSKNSVRFDAQNRATFNITRAFDTSVDYSMKISLAADAAESRFRVTLDGVNATVPVRGLPLAGNEFNVRVGGGAGSGAAVSPEIQQLRDQIAALQREVDRARTSGSPDAPALQGQLTTLTQLLLAQNQQRQTPQTQTTQTTQTQEETTQRDRSQTRASGRGRSLSLRDTDQTQFQEEEQVRQTRPAQAAGDLREPTGRAAADEGGTATQKRATLASTPRLRRAPDSSGTGPEVLVYAVILGASQLAWYLKKRKKG